MSEKYVNPYKTELLAFVLISNFLLFSEMLRDKSTKLPVIGENFSHVIHKIEDEEKADKKGREQFF